MPSAAATAWPIGLPSGRPPSSQSHTPSANRPVPGCDLHREPRLPRAADAGEGHQRPRPERSTDTLDLLTAADETARPPRQVALRGCRRQRRIVDEDPPVQRLRLVCGLDTQLVVEPGAQVVVGGQRVGLPAHCVQRPHERDRGSLPGRVAATSASSPGSASAARPSSSSVRARSSSAPVRSSRQPGDRGGGELVVGELGEGVAPPQASAASRSASARTWSPAAAAARAAPTSCSNSAASSVAPSRVRQYPGGRCRSGDRGSEDAAQPRDVGPKRGDAPRGAASRQRAATSRSAGTTSPRGHEQDREQRRGLGPPSATRSVRRPRPATVRGSGSALSLARPPCLVACNRTAMGATDSSGGQTKEDTEMSTPTRRPTLAVGVTPMETRHDVVMHLAERAEALGYDAFLLAEGWGHDAAVLLAAIAGRTRRIRLGTGVLNIWGRSPAAIAMLATSLDAVSGGRFVLGLGAGSPQLAGACTAERSPSRSPSSGRSPARSERCSPVNGPPAGRCGWPSTRDAGDSRAPRRARASGRAAGRRAGRRVVPLPDPAIGAHGGDRAAAGRRGTRRSPGGRWSAPGCRSRSRRIPRPRASARVVVGGDLPDAAWDRCMPRTLRRHGLGTAVDAVLAANPTQRTTDVPADRGGTPRRAHRPGRRRGAAGPRWTAGTEAGADLPVLVLPPRRPVAELEYALDVLRPIPPAGNGSPSRDDSVPCEGGKGLGPDRR